MKAVITSDSGEFLKLGDGLLKELKPKKLPKPKKDVFSPYYPKRKRIKNKSYRRQRNRMKRDFRRGL